MARLVAVAWTTIAAPYLPYNFLKVRPQYIDGLVQENVTPVRQQWSYVFLALTHRHVVGIYW